MPPLRLAVPLEGEGVAALPRGATRRPDKVVGAVALLAQAPVLTPSRCEATALAVLHDRLGDPLDAWVVADRGVRRVYGDHLAMASGTGEEIPGKGSRAVS